MLTSVVVTGTAGWPRIVASGALWATVYNLVWGVAWFAFMRSVRIPAIVNAHSGHRDHRFRAS